MQVASGTRLGPYEILERIGAGAMGEVYRARDVRLSRTVAIKVLPAAVSNDPRRRRRLEQEAKAISALNHPHICTLHDVGSENGLDYLVLEYCDGTTLAQRLLRGALPIDEVLRYGAQLSDALSRAHSAGFVHRDLKPANIILTKSGVKLLDFGIATRDEDGQTVADSTTAPVGDSLVGSLPYMAPELFSGSEADVRSDIFSLGVVLYEMVTGKRPFDGDSSSSVIGAIVTHVPPAAGEMRPAVPPALDHVISRCLSKASEERWASAHDIAEHLHWMATTKVAKALPFRWSRFLIVGGVLVVAAIVAAITLMSRGEPPASAPRLSIALSEVAGGNETPAIFPAHLMSNVAISPDGSRIAYSAMRNGVSHLYVRHLDRFESVELEGTRGAAGPFFSPDGQWIGFVSGGAIHKVRPEGGAPQTITRGLPQNARGATWASDQTIYFSPGASFGIWSVSANGGPVRVLTEPDASRDETGHRWPALLPGEKQLLITIRDGRITTFDHAKIAVLDLASRQSRVIFEGGSRARYVPSGHLLFAREGGLHAVPFDLKSLTVRGKPRLVLSGVVTMYAGGMADFDLSAGGDLVYVPGSISQGLTEVVLTSRAGQLRTLGTLPFTAIRPELSPDGQKLAVNAVFANDDIFIYDVRTGVSNRLSFEPGDETNAVFTANGETVIYNSFRPPRLLARPTNGSSQATELVAASAPYPWSCSPDGQFLMYSDTSRDTGIDLWLLPLKRSGPPIPFLRTASNETAGRFSPDGRWVAYVSNESGKAEVYIRSLAPGGGRWQVSAAGGAAPRWSPDGTEVFYRDGDDLLAVGIVADGNRITPGRPERLFTLPFSMDAFCPIREGFIGLRNATLHTSRPEHINVIPNWTRELAD